MRERRMSETREPLFPGRLVLRLEVPNEDNVHPDVMRDDISDALAAWGFSDFTLDAEGSSDRLRTGNETP